MNDDLITAEADADTTKAKEEVADEAQIETKSEHTDKEIDFDAELERERKPDPEKAKQAFKERQAKKAEEVEDEPDDEDRPLTRKEFEELREADRKISLQTAALAVAQGIANSSKEAELMVEKWKNRSFPPHLTLAEQMEEVYGAIYAKKIIGERNEALRGLKAKDLVNKSSTGDVKDGMTPKVQKLKPAVETAIKAAGFEFNITSRRWEKKMGDGSILVSDPNTGKSTLVKP